MKRPLAFKFLFGYLFCMILLIFSSITFGRDYIEDYVFGETRSKLYTYAQFVEDKYFMELYSSGSAHVNTEITKEIQKYDLVLQTHVCVTNQTGAVLANSENVNYQSDNQITVTDYDKDFFSQYYYENKSLPPLIQESALIVTFPATINYSIRGYVIVYQPMEILEQSISHYERILFFVLAGIGIILALLLVYCWFLTAHPSKKIAQAISAYASGDYQHVLSLHGRDEYEQINEQLNFLVEQLRDLDDYQKNFIANVSHDFRSPLTSIKGYAEAMQDGTIPPEMYNKYLDIITFETERLTKLTSNLLSLNSFERGRATLDITSFDINHVIKRTASAFERICTQKKVKLNLTFSEKETFVNADMSKIQQVLHNLIDNAIKFSHNDSQIRITTMEKKEKVIISIKDFGIGIPKSSQKKIWERFYKTDLSRGKDRKGTGLGLSITKEIINAHNENINVTSTEGVGTEFTFSLPLTNPNEI